MKPNPIHREGTKNVMCSHYRDCLDHAARRYWQFWDCSECTPGIAPNAHTNQNENHWATGDLDMIQALTPTSLG
jgi:hypothetical protein